MRYAASPRSQDAVVILHIWKGCAVKHSWGTTLLTPFQEIQWLVI